MGVGLERRILRLLRSLPPRRVLRLRARSGHRHHYDGGYGEYMVAPASAVALMPDDLPPVEAAPLMCAGLTTFNALRNSGARPGDVVAVLGLGGLGHLGVQYAAKMGFHTVGIARGQGQGAARPQARRGGLHRQPGAGPGGGTAEAGRGEGHPGDGDQRRGDERRAGRPGRQRHAAWSSARPSRCRSRRSVLLMGCRSVKGWYSGTSIDSQDTLAFSVRSGVRSMNEIYPLDRVSEAYDRMMSGKARFRVVLTIGAIGIRRQCLRVSQRQPLTLLASSGRVEAGVPEEEVMPTRNINLTERYDRFVEDQIAEGRYQNASEVLAQACDSSSNRPGKTRRNSPCSAGWQPSRLIRSIVGRVSLPRTSES